MKNAGSSAKPQHTGPAPLDSPPEGLPPSARLERIAFLHTAENSTDNLPAAILQFDDPPGMRAVSADAGLFPGANSSDNGFHLLLVPLEPPSDQPLPQAAIDWVAAERQAPEGMLMLSLHGASLAWSPHRTAVAAGPERLPAVRLAIIEFCYREMKLRSIERGVAEGRGAEETDARLVFEFDDRALGQRDALSRRYQQTLAMRSQLARLMPSLQRPPLHPPTLASQIGERLRDRTRLADRADWAGGELEVRERLYEACGQRATDWTIARRQSTVEWLIVLLLAIETLLLVVDLLASVGG